jgi:hypothetical protein
MFCGDILCALFLQGINIVFIKQKKRGENALCCSLLKLESDNQSIAATVRNLGKTVGECKDIIEHNPYYHRTEKGDSS